MRTLHLASAPAVLGAAVLMSACFLEPCRFAGPTISGTWSISSVNGQPIPAGGYPLPSGTDRLSGGTLYLGLLDASCDGREEERPASSNEHGTVVADYTIVTAAGAPMPSRTYAGGFEHSFSTAVVMISADGQSASGRHASSSNTMTFTGTLPNLGGLTVVFRRIQ
jgi:hypothetical protein